MISTWPLESEYNVNKEDIFYRFLHQLYEAEGALQATDLNVTPDTDGIGVKIAPGGAIVAYDSVFGGKRVFQNSAENKSGPNKFPNSSFAVDLANWIPVGAATLTRDTGTYHSSPASMRIATSGATTFNEGARILGGLMKVNPGELQEISFWYKAAPIGIQVKLKVAEESVHLQNPGFETDLSGWSFSATGTRDTVEKYAGAASCKVVTSGGAPWQGIYQTTAFAAAPGQVWKGKVFAKGSGSVLLVVHALTAAEELISDYYSAPITLTSSWQEIPIVTAAFPANTAKTRIMFTTNITPQAVTFYVDSFEFSKSGTVKEVIGTGTDDWMKLKVPVWKVASDTNYLSAEVLIGAGSAQYVYVDDFALTPNFDWPEGFEVANPVNPRVDRVVVQIRDANVAGGGDTEISGKFRAVTGTPTSGATLVNLSGAAAIPANSLLIANVLVPAGASKLVSGNIDNAVRAVSSLSPSASTIADISDLQGDITTLQGSISTLDGRIDDLETAFGNEIFSTPVSPVEAVGTLANYATLTRFTVDRGITVVSVGFIVVGSAGNIDCGIYGLSGGVFTRLWSRGSVACPSAGSAGYSISSGSPTSLVLEPGVYWLALVGNNGAFSYAGLATSISGISNDTTDTAFTLPSSISGYSTANRSIHGIITGS